MSQTVTQSDTQPIHTRVIPGKDGYSWVEVNPRLGFIYRALKRPGKDGRKDKIQCAYFGFQSEEEAKRFHLYVQAHHSARALVREGDRLGWCTYEVKVWEYPELLQLILVCAYKAQVQAQLEEQSSHAA